MIPSGVAACSWLVDVNVFSDHSVVDERSEGGADGVLQVQSVLTHPPIEIVKLSKTVVNSPHHCLFDRKSC